MFDKRDCRRIDFNAAGKPGDVSGDFKVPVVSSESALTVSERLCGVFINGRQAISAVISPGYEKEFGAGFLLTEGIIADFSEIESIMVDGGKVSVMTTTPRKIIFSKKTVLSGCGGADTKVDYSRIPEAPAGVNVAASVIFNAVSQLKRSMERSMERCCDDYVRDCGSGVNCGNGDCVGNGGLEYAGVFGTDGINVSFAADIRLDNAVDKAIGAAFLSGTNLSGCFIAVSGRVSSEIVRKCLFAQISLIASGGNVTSLAVDVALKRGLTLIGHVYPERETLSVFSDSGRMV